MIYGCGWLLGPGSVLAFPTAAIYLPTRSGKAWETSTESTGPGASSGIQSFTWALDTGVNVYPSPPEPSPFSPPAALHQARPYQCPPGPLPQPPDCPAPTPVPPDSLRFPSAELTPFPPSAIRSGIGPLTASGQALTGLSQSSIGSVGKRIKLEPLRCLPQGDK